MLFNRQIKLKESEDSITLGVECQNVLMFYDKDDMVNFEPGEYTRRCFFSWLHTTGGLNVKHFYHCL